MKSLRFKKIIKSTYFKIGVNILVLVLAGYVISQRLSNEQFWQSMRNLPLNQNPFLVGAIVFSWFLNLFLDVKLWQKAVEGFHKSSFISTLVDNLKFYAYAFISPANSGGLIARVGRYKRKKDKAFALIASAQLGTARYMARITIGGSLTVFLICAFYISLLLSALVALLFAVGSFLVILNLGKFVRIKQLRKFTWLKKVIPKPTKGNNFKSALFYLACLRFSVFNLQFMLLLIVFGVAPSMEMAINVPAFFFTSTLIPALPAFDFLVKGAVGLAAFRYFDDIPDVLLAATTLLWAMNWALPALSGIFVRRKVV